MSSKIVIVDYGMGNLHSVNKAIAAVGGDPVISSDAAVIAQADMAPMSRRVAIVLPAAS